MTFIAARALAVSIVFAAATAPAASGTQASATTAPAPTPPSVRHWQAGPRTIDLGHDVRLTLPEHYLFLPMPDADELMQQLGNFYNQNLLGVVVGDRDSPWLVSLRYSEDGHVDDREPIDAAGLMQTIRNGTEEGNEERVMRGHKPAHVEGWSELPRYDAKLHRLSWALTLRSEEGDTINYATRVLGRRGVVALNLITPPERLLSDRVHAQEVLAAIAFAPGARYEDFDQARDRVAEYGLMGLILGGGALGAAKLVKLGLMAKFWKAIAGFLLSGKKAIAGLFIAVYAAIRGLFGRAEKDAPK